MKYTQPRVSLQRATTQKPYPAVYSDSLRNLHIERPLPEGMKYVSRTPTLIV